MEWIEFDDHPITQMSMMNEKEREDYWEAYDKKSTRLLIIAAVIGIALLLFHLCI